MAFVPPTFNVLADFWFCGNFPALGDPDFENQECQLYLPTRVVVGVDRSTHNYLLSPIQLRMPFAAISNWQSVNVAEVPAESGRYYLAQFKEVQHLGFPNQYLIVQCYQCDDNGDPIFRDVCLNFPVEHFASLSAAVGVDVSPGTMTAERTHTNHGELIGDTIVNVFFENATAHRN